MAIGPWVRGRAWAVQPAAIVLAWLAEGQNVEFAVPDLPHGYFLHSCGKQIRGSDDGSWVVLEEGPGDKLVLVALGQLLRFVHHHFT